MGCRDWCLECSGEANPNPNQSISMHMRDGGGGRAVFELLENAAFWNRERTHDSTFARLVGSSARLHLKR